MARKSKTRKDINKLLADDALITAAMRRGVREALRRHKQARNPICEWRDGKVVWIQPEDTPINAGPNGARN